MKWVIAIATAAALLVVIATVFVVSLDVEQYRDDVTAFVEARTGRRLSIDGDIGLKLSLVPTLDIKGVRFADAAWSQTDDIMTVERIEARLALTALARAEVRLKRLVLEGVELNLETDRKGRGNWLLAPPVETARVPGAWQPRYDLESVVLSHVTVRYREYDGNEQRLDIRNLKLIEQGVGRPLELELGATLANSDLTAHGHVSRLRRLLRDEPFEFSLDGRLGEIGFSVRGETGVPSRSFAEKIAFDVNAPDLATLGAAFGSKLPAGAPTRFTGTATRGAGGYRLHPFEFASGRSTLSGDLVIESAAGRWRLDGRIAASKLVSGEFLAATPEAAGSERLFSPSQLPFGPLAGADAAIVFDIDSLDTPYARFTNLEGRAELSNGELVIDELKGHVADGVFTAKLELDVTEEQAQAGGELSLQQAKLERLLPLAADGRVSGGAFDFGLRLTGSGNSMRALMASADGMFTLDVGPAVFNNDMVNLAETDLLWSFVTRLNPLAEQDPLTRIGCAAVRFPIVDGLASNAIGIGLLTQNLSVLGGGTINLATERIDIGARPKPREGIGLSISSLADFVRLGGTLKHPRAITDNAGIATAGAKVGAAFATMGLSVVAEGLYDRATASDDVCAVVRDSLSSQPTKSAGNSVIETTTSKTKAAVRDAGAALKNAFDSLFGD